MSKQIIMTGATGLIGTGLARALIRRGDKVYVFSRSPEKGRREIPGAEDYIKWIPEDYENWMKSVNGKDCIIHLAGAPVMARRWTPKYKAEILSSRQIGTRSIVRAIKEAPAKPDVLVSASAIGYYGTNEDGVFKETAPAGSDFLAAVCKIWEKEASEVENTGVRRVSIRLGIVLSPEGGALQRMITPYRFFIGGPLGNGKQGFPWIHIDDAIDIFLKAIDDSSLKGPVNAAAPETLSMNEFSRAIGTVMKKPSLFKVPGFVLKLVVGEGAETITKTPRVIPSVLLEHNFHFKYDKAEKALEEILKSRPT